MQSVRVLASEIGPRPAGSAAERRAREYLQARLGELGASVETRPFTFRGWRALAPPELHVEGQKLETVALPYTFATGPDGVEGVLRFEGDWPVIPGRLSCPRFRVEDAAGDTRAAVLASPAGEARQLPNTLPLLSLPTVVIGADDGQRLRALLRRNGMRARVACPQAWERPLQSANLVVDLAGADRIILVLAHYDPVEGSQGANDNASGAALLLRLVRRLRDADAGGVRFVLCGAEEPFLVGSRSYAAELSTNGELTRIAACLNLDMVGVGEKFSVRRADDSLWVRAAGAVGRSSPAGLPIGEAGAMPSSDHWAFHELGVPSAQLTREPDHPWHSRGDITDRFSDAELDDVEAVAARLLEAAHEELSRR
jgi:aminopeptidase YwaD